MGATAVAVGAAVAGAVVSSALAPKGPGAPPPIPKPAVMPTPDDELAKQAKRRALATMQARSGRVSTILSQDGNQETLGG